MLTKELRQSLLLVWPLLAGLLLIMTGNGLQGTLLGLRASGEGFPVYATGIIMSLYYSGYLIGCYVTPRLISSVGHIRVFAALASGASTTILLHGVFIDPWIWAFIRLLSGISFAGLFIVSESWLNSIATNRLRGQIFGSYVFIMQAGLMVGQLFIGFGSVMEIGHFVLVSVLVSISLVPLMLANKAAPGYQEPEALPFRKLIKISPLSVGCVVLSGFSGATIMSIGAVYANEIGFRTPEIALFLAIYILGSGTLTLIFGSLSDLVERRRVIIVVTLLSMCVAFTLGLTHQAFFVMVFILGGCVTSLYSLGIAHMGDKIKSTQLVSASTSMIFLNGLGAAFGPLSVGTLMSLFGAQAFFAALTVASGILFVFALYRAFVSESVGLEDQGEFITMPMRSATTAMQIAEED